MRRKPTEEEIRASLCEVGFHDVYLTMCILGYDYKCRHCDIVRYFDVIPPEWAKEDPYRNQQNIGYPLDAEGNYIGDFPL